jgi:hydroxyacylglutathione hydrolase
MSKIDIIPVLCRNDNYAYVLRNEDNDLTAVIDPSLSSPVQDFLNKKGWKLDYILNTHHHYDHTDGNLELKTDNNAKVVGSLSDKSRIPGIDIFVSEKEPFVLGDNKITIMEVNGHTKGHVTYYLEEENAIFTGDVLFSLGCGGMFEGNSSELWQSLKKIRDNTNDETMMYPGHEYTLHCARFVYSIDSNNENLIKRLENAAMLANAGKPTIPVKMKVEKKTNPYLRLDDKEFQKQLGFGGNEPAKFMDFLHGG